jgi:hypothetical protein
MRSIFRNTLVAFVAVLAIGAVGAASASAALPEFSPSHGVTFKGSAAVSISFFEVSGLSPVPNCESHTTSGAITGAKSGTIEIEMKGCHAGGFGAACSTTGKPAGVVAFSGTLEPVYLAKEPKNVGLLVKLNEFTAHCGLATAVVHGSFLGSITPINKKVTTIERFTLIAKETKGTNEFTTYETESGERKSALLSESIEGGPFVQAGYQSTEQLIPSVQTELKA